MGNSLNKSTTRRLKAALLLMAENNVTVVVTPDTTALERVRKQLKAVIAQTKGDDEISMADLMAKTRSLLRTAEGLEGGCEQYEDDLDALWLMVDPARDAE